MASKKPVSSAPAKEPTPAAASVPQPEPPQQQSQASTSARPAEESTIDVSKLSHDKIKQLMRGDPKFIERLISQLDKQMHNMMLQKVQRQEQIAADLKEIEKLDQIINSHVKPNLDRLNESISAKTELRSSVAKQLDDQTNNLKAMEREAAALIQSARTRTTKLMRATASQRLEEARGFSATVPTSTLVRGALSTSKSSIKS
mmetsp:Transcript_6741/g.14877  ORF Transcript_6741/g.14877 Transcript_6741/m.14877 type:complete len:202 (-) Transcript_6741:482-1087(-)